MSREREAPRTDSRWQLGSPRCPDCQTPLIYDTPFDHWECAIHGAVWSGLTLAISRGFAPATELPGEARTNVKGQVVDGDVLP